LPRAPPGAVRLRRKELLKIMHGTYNEMLAISGNAKAVLGVVPRAEILEFKLYPGNFEATLLKVGELLLYASCSSKEYAHFALFKEDAETVEGPLGPAPRRWYLGVRCKLLVYAFGFPSHISCEPLEAYWVPAPPPKRAFFYILEALVLATRLHLRDYRNEIKFLLKEAVRLGDEEDRETAKKILEFIGHGRAGSP